MRNIIILFLCVFLFSQCTGFTQTRPSYLQLQNCPVVYVEHHRGSSTGLRSDKDTIQAAILAAYSKGCQTSFGTPQVAIEFPAAKEYQVSGDIPFGPPSGVYPLMIKLVVRGNGSRIVWTPTLAEDKFFAHVERWSQSVISDLHIVPGDYAGVKGNIFYNNTWPAGVSVNNNTVFERCIFGADASLALGGGYSPNGTFKRAFTSVGRGMGDRLKLVDCSVFNVWNVCLIENPESINWTFERSSFYSGLDDVVLFDIRAINDGFNITNSSIEMKGDNNTLIRMDKSIPSIGGYDASSLSYSASSMRASMVNTRVEPPSISTYTYTIANIADGRFDCKGLNTAVGNGADVSNSYLTIVGSDGVVSFKDCGFLQGQLQVHARKSSTDLFYSPVGLTIENSKLVGELSYVVSGVTYNPLTLILNWKAKLIPAVNIRNTDYLGYKDVQRLYADTQFPAEKRTITISRDFDNGYVYPVTNDEIYPITLPPWIVIEKIKLTAEPIIASLSLRLSIGSFTQNIPLKGLGRFVASDVIVLPNTSGIYVAGPWAQRLVSSHFVDGAGVATSTLSPGFLELTYRGITSRSDLNATDTAVTGRLP